MSYMNNTFQSNYDYSKDKNFMSTDIGPSMREMKAQKRRSRPMDNPDADNPYIPKFISTAPWYAQDDDAVERLAHQRIGKKETPSGGRSSIEGSWYVRGKKLGPAATKYRKGACENCGAMSHKVKDCMERPRKRGARWTGEDIQADEVIQDINVSWDAKRDRWNGYDATDYKKVIERYEKLDELQNKGEENRDASENSKNSAVKASRNSTVSGSEDSASITTPSLRMREDVVAYLRADNKNLQYEPKSRSMRDETGYHMVDDSSGGAGFVKASGGEKEDFEKLQMFAWEAERSGTRVHVVANPTAGELEFRKNKASRMTTQKQIDQSILDRYGDGTSKVKDKKAKNNEKEVPDSAILDKSEKSKGESNTDEESENLVIVEGDL